MIVLVLPLPPSVNNLFVNGKRGRFKSQKYKDWEADAGMYLMQQRFPKGEITGPYVMEIKLPMKVKGDISNRIKAAEDCLVGIGVIPDDRHAHRITVMRDDQVPAEDCYISVEQA